MADIRDRKQTGVYNLEVLTEEIVYKKNSQQLTALLYEGLIESLEAAITLIEQKNYIDANKRLQKANDILRRLGVGLKYDAGIIAHQLDALYNYMAERLIEANMKKDVSIIKEVLQLITTISSAWNEALKKEPQPMTKSFMQKAAAYEKFVTTYEEK
jgi:flagellar secretion chaperone FliS